MLLRLFRPGIRKTQSETDPETACFRHNCPAAGCASVQCGDPRWALPFSLTFATMLLLLAVSCLSGRSSLRRRQYLRTTCHSVQNSVRFRHKVFPKNIVRVPRHRPLLADERCHVTWRRGPNKRLEGTVAGRFLPIRDPSRGTPSRQQCQASYSLPPIPRPGRARYRFSQRGDNSRIGRCTSRISVRDFTISSVWGLLTGWLRRYCCSWRTWRSRSIVLAVAPWLRRMISWPARAIALA